MGLFFLGGLARLVYLRRVKDAYPWWSPLYRFKQTLSLCLLLFEFSMFLEALAKRRTAYYPFSAFALMFGQASLCAAADMATDANTQIVAIVYQYWEHKKGSRIPAMMTLYWLGLTCVDGIKLRTFILRQQVGAGGCWCWWELMTRTA